MSALDSFGNVVPASWPRRPVTSFLVDKSDGLRPHVDAAGVLPDGAGDHLRPPDADSHRDLPDEAGGDTTLHTVANTCESPYTAQLGGTPVDGPHTVELVLTDDVGNTATVTSRASRSIASTPASLSATRTRAPSSASRSRPPSRSSDTFTAGGDILVRVPDRPRELRLVLGPRPASGPAHPDRPRDRPRRATTTEVTRNFTYDSTAPAVSITDGPDEDEVIYTPSTHFDFTVTDGTATTTTCKLDTGAFGPCSGPGLRHSLTGLDVGLHTFTVRSIDAAGPRRPSSSATSPLPTTATRASPSTPRPTVAVVTAPFTPAWTVSDDFSSPGDIDVTCRIDGGAFGSCASLAPPDGSRTLTVRATDQSGNVTDVARPFVYDTTAPAVAITDGPAQDSVSTATAATIVFTVADATATTITCKLDGGAFGACTGGRPSRGHRAGRRRPHDHRARGRRGRSRDRARAAVRRVRPARHHGDGRDRWDRRHRATGGTGAAGTRGTGAPGDGRRWPARRRRGRRRLDVAPLTLEPQRALPRAPRAHVGARADAARASRRGRSSRSTAEAAGARSARRRGRRRTASIALKSLFGKRKLRPGAVITIRVTQGGRTGAVRITTRRGRSPRRAASA